MKLARYSKALSHPARIAIIRFLILKGKSSFGDISREVPLSASTVSQHLLELINAGLIKSNYDPPKVIYILNNDAWKETRKMIKELARLKPKIPVNDD